MDTLKIVSATGTLTLPTISNVEVIEAQSLAGLTINTSTVAGLTNLNVTKVGAAGVVAATAAATTDVSVAMKAAGAAVGVVGGKNVTVKLTDVAAAADVVTVGATAPKGDVVVEMTGKAYVAGSTNYTLSAVNVTGGKTVSVTQKATSNASAAAADTAISIATNGVITQGAVAITGNADTTAVTVKQDAAVTAKAAANTTGGVTESASVKFGVLKSGDVLEVAGLTFKAGVDMTAAEVAATFANLVNNAAFAAPATIAAGDTQSGAAAGKGTYTLVGTAWTSGAATGDTVVFTSTTARTDVGNLVPALTNTSGTSVAPVVTTTAGKAHDVTATGGVLGVVAGAVSVADAAGTIKTVTVDGYSVAGSALTGGAVLDTLNLSNGGAFTSANAAAALNLTLEKVNGVYTQTAGAATLNVKSVGANTAGLAAANTTALNVSGSGLLNASTGSVLTNLATIKVTETAGLNLGATALAAVTSVDTTGTTGAVTVAIDSTKATYAGGAGVDSVTFSNTTAATKALDLGAGNDTLVFAAATAAVPTVVLKGGAGDDTVSLDAANAVTFSGSTAFAAQLDSFERLALTGATGAQNVDLGKLGFTNHVTVAGVAAAGALTLTDLANNGTVVLTADLGAGAGITAAIKDAATGTADVLNVQLVKGTALAGGTLTAANVETVNITATDTVVPPTAGAAIDTHTLTLAADKATAVNVTGNAGLTLTTTNSTKVTSIDGSAMTGNLTATSTNTTAATTIKGGSGNDVLTAATGTTADVLLGGAGNDVLVGNKGLSTLTGGAGNDVFVLNVASLDVNSYTTITDFAAGDLLQIAGATTFAAAKVTLGDTAVFQDYANAAMNVLNQVVDGTDVAVGWFQFGGNTYVVADAGATDSTTFVNGEDFVVKLTGLVDLSNASFNDTYNTVAL